MISLLPSATAHGLPVDPILDKVISITKLNEAEDAKSANKPPGTAKAESGSQPATTSSIKSSPDMGAGIPEFMPTVATDPMPELPQVESFESWRNIARTPGPVRTSVERVAVTTAAVEPVEPSILQSSDHGWKLFDVAWYWWMVLVGMGYYSIKKILHLRRRMYVGDIAA